MNSEVVSDVEAGVGGAAVQAAVPFVESVRGGIVESLHRGHAVVIDGAGRSVMVFGAPGAATFARSAIKPFQALPLITSGAADRFGLAPQELAVICGSHDAERPHTDAVLSILGKIGLSASSLKCGPHEPYSKEAATELSERGERPAPIHNNCSGKHAGMLALASHLGAHVETYDRPDHPVQREVFAATAQFSGLPAAGLRYAVDGCGLPTFALSIETMARMFARFVAPPAHFGEPTQRACRRLINAMIAHPEMVEGDGELDTELMRVAGGRLVSKVGAEGLYTAGVLPCAEWPQGLGLAFKIEDGDKGDRARSVAAIALLLRLKVLREDEVRALGQLARPTSKNHRGEEVGEIRPAATLAPQA